MCGEYTVISVYLCNQLQLLKILLNFHMVKSQTRGSTNKANHVPFGIPFTWNLIGPI